MRGHLNIAGKAAKANVKVVGHELNPQLLINKDLDAFAVCRDYKRHLNEGNIGKVEAIKVANPDLLPYFKWIEREYLRDSANTKVDQFDVAV